MSKLVVLVLALALVTPILAKPIDADAAWGYWKQDRYGWRFEFSTGGYATGWNEDSSGTVYYFNETTGYMVTGWQYIVTESVGNWYYFNASGAMHRGWLQSGGYWYYMDQNGIMLTGNQTIGGVNYFFNSDGTMATGWKYENSKWYYRDSSGALAQGWKAIGGTWYYFDPSAYYMYEGMKDIGGQRYYFQPSSGAMVTGWKLIDGAWYYFDASGAMARNRWIGNYYMLSDGKMATNQWIGSYYVGSDGVWISGFTHNYTGWCTSGGKWYFYKNGEMATEWWEIGSDEYYFDPNTGVMQTGWLYWDGVWFYFEGSGRMATGWKQIGGTYYYFYPTGSDYYYSGEMATNTYIGSYYVNSNGAWVR